MSTPILLKNLIRSVPGKLVAVVIGYHSWFLISSWLPAQRWLEVPLSFYNTPAAAQIVAPETVKILISGSRTALHNLDTEQLAVHIDTQTLPTGTSIVTLTTDHILMPRSLHITQWSPSNLTVTIQNSSGNTRIPS